MKKVPLMFSVLITSVLLSTNALAYINPGLGGAIIGTLWPLLVTIFLAVLAFVVKWFWRPIKKAFSKVLRH